MSIPVFSHSKLSTFEQCQKKYEFTYVGDRPAEKAPGSIEGFMGKRVHESLELLYTLAYDEKPLSEQELLAHFYTIWRDNFNENVIIVKGTEDEYIKTGFDCLSRYYRRFYPFTQHKLLATEKRITISLDEANKYRINGIIDRIDQISEGILSIHDYKTTGRLATQKQCDNDRQLALYELGVRKLYPEAKEVRLIWHYLQFDSDVESRRHKDQLDDLRRSVISKIDEIVATTKAGRFYTNVTKLCDWCDFKNQCPAFKKGL